MWLLVHGEDMQRPFMGAAGVYLDQIVTIDAEMAGVSQAWTGRPQCCAKHMDEMVQPHGCELCFGVHEGDDAIGDCE